MKTQQIRLIDVFILGPLMVRSGWLNRKESSFIGLAMMIAGAGTIVYNWQNYREVEKEQK